MKDLKDTTTLMSVEKFALRSPEVMRSLALYLERGQNNIQNSRSDFGRREKKK
jgi:hypothetical protein